MKIQLTLATIFLFAATLHAQQSSLLLSGGYVFGNSADTDNSLSGYRINALYEFNPTLGKFSHGLNFGYLYSTSESDDDLVTVKVTNWPIYYAPKYRFGQGKAKPFVKGALGVQFSSLKQEGPALGLSSSDTGFFAGAGAGLEVGVSDKVFLVVEYEWAYCSNSYYNDGFVNSAMGGLGFRF
jgi:opacity protein-like surface antigen